MSIKSKTIWSKKTRSNININLTPIIDVALTLVIILIISMPKSSNFYSIHQNLRTKNLICNILINKDQEIYIDNEKIDINKINISLKEKIKKNNNIAINIHVAKNINYDIFFKIYNKVLATGVKRIAFTKV